MRHAALAVRTAKELSKMRTPWFDWLIIGMAVVALIALIAIKAFLPAVVIVVLMGIAVAADHQLPHGKLRF